MHLAYEQDYGKALDKVLRSELSGNLANFLASMGTDRSAGDSHEVLKGLNISYYRAQLDVMHLADTLGRMNTKESILVDIFTTRSNAVLKRISRIYGEQNGV